MVLHGLGKNLWGGGDVEKRPKLRQKTTKRLNWPKISPNCFIVVKMKKKCMLSEV